MYFKETELPGAFIIELDKITDNRGFFARTWCREEFEKHGLNPNLAQCNLSFNEKRGTLRGMHFQTPPYQEAKLVSCIKGSIYDVIIDLRPEFPTYKNHFSIKLTADNRNCLYIPEGFAHGFMTLEDSTEVFYQISEFFKPDYAHGCRWNDSAFNINWPLSNPIMSERDKNCPDFEKVEEVLIR